MLFSSSCPAAPKSSAIGRRKIMPSTDSTTPQAAETVTISVKISFAFLSSPSPMVFAISAPPPVPNIKPIQPNIISTGIIKFTAAKGVLPA